MKSFMSNISRVFLVVLAIFLFGKKVNANEVTNYNDIFLTNSTENNSVYISDKINKFALEHYAEISDYAREYIGENGDTEEKLYIGEPFCVINVDEINQQSVVYYPIMDTNKKYKLLMEVVCINNELQCGVSTEMVECLNQIDYYNRDYVFYLEDDILIAQSDLEKVEFFGDSKEIYYDSLDYFKLYNKSIGVMSNIEQSYVNITDYDNTEIVMEKYQAKFSSQINDTNLKETMLKLNNPKGQGNHNLCWAASVATIVNYVNGKDISARAVADIIGRNYEKGGTIYDKQNALEKYKIKYEIRRGRVLKWAEIIKNIDAKKPVSISARSLDLGHSVTIIGYRRHKADEYIAIGDSALNNDLGGTKIIYYKGEKTTFKSSVNGPVFTWVSSLSKK